jgi:hypothetical protein
MRPLIILLALALLVRVLWVVYELQRLSKAGYLYGTL